MYWGVFSGTLGRLRRDRDADAREGDIAKSRADVSTARRGLGFEATAGLEEGLAELVDERVEER